MKALKLGMVLVAFWAADSAWAITCRAYKESEATKGYTLPWISGISRVVTASTCSKSNTFHSTSATWLHNINDATFAYDFRMRYEPVCTMSSGWMIEFRDREPDLAGTNFTGTSNFMKIVTPNNRVDYYTHLRQNWWTETGQPQYNHLDRRKKILGLASAQGKLKWQPLVDGRYRLVHANGSSLTFNQIAIMAAQGLLADLHVPRAHCIAYSGSSGTTAPHLHVESRCSLTDSRTCPLEFENAMRVNSKGDPLGRETGLLDERAIYLAR